MQAIRLWPQQRRSLVSQTFLNNINSTTLNQLKRAIFHVRFTLWRRISNPVVICGRPEFKWGLRKCRYANIYMTFGVLSNTLHCIQTASQMTLSDTKWYFTQAIHNTKCTSSTHKTHKLSLIHYSWYITSWRCPPSTAKHYLKRFTNSIKNSNLDATSRDVWSQFQPNQSSSLTARGWGSCRKERCGRPCEDLLAV